MRVEDQSRLSARVIEARLHDQRGSTLDVEQLESDIADIYGLDIFETVNYSLNLDDDETELVVRDTPKSWGPNYLRFGINLEDDFDGTSNYNVAVRFTKTEVNEKGGEFRAEAQIGEHPRLFAEFYQPLDYASRWFINPTIGIERSNTNVFENGQRIAQFRSEETQVSFAVGRQFENWGEARLTITKGYGDSNIGIGDPSVASTDIELGAVAASVGYDTIDYLSVPRDGTAFNALWLSARRSLGSDVDFDLAQLFFLRPQTWGRNTILHWWDFGSVREGTADPLSAFSLGGLFNLSGLAADQIIGQHAAIGRLLYYRRIGEPTTPGLGIPIYVGGSLEAGNVWDDTDDVSVANTLTAGSVFVVLDTVLGPVYLAYGVAEGGHRSAYLFLGQTF